MKKILVALALAAFASSTFASVAGSKHDFNLSATYGTNKPSRCVYCHVPHAAQTWAMTALWAVPQGNAVIGTLQLYTGGLTVDTRESLTCLSCHADGTAANTGLLTDITGSANIGTDLRNDHPIGDAAKFTPGTTSGIVNAQILIGYSTFDIGTEYQVQCGTCHNPHNSRTFTGRKLLSMRPTTATPPGTQTDDFCGYCHTR